MCQWAAEDGGADQDRFELEEKPSPAGGLRYKVLKLKPTFPLPRTPDSSAGAADVIESEQSYTFLSRYLGSTKDKPGCPVDGLYKETVKNKMFDRIAALPVPKDKESAQAVLSFLEGLKCEHKKALNHYRKALGKPLLG